MNTYGMQNLVNRDVRLPLYFASNRLTPMEFYVYDVNILSIGVKTTLAATCFTAKRQLNRAKANKGYQAFTDKEHVYTLKEIEEEDLHYDFPKREDKEKPYVFELKPAGKTVIPLTNAFVYETYIKQALLDFFAKQEDFYIRDDNVFTPAILINYNKENPEYTRIYNNDRGVKTIRLDREIIFHPHVYPDGRYCLQMDYSVRLLNRATVYDIYKEHGGNEQGLDWMIQHKLHVRNELPTKSFAGTIIKMPHDPQKCAWHDKTREDLIQYFNKKYKNPKITNRINKDPEDDIPVAVQLKKGGIIPCLTYTLGLVPSNESVWRHDPKFSKNIMKYKKLSMSQRHTLDVLILRRIGTIKKLQASFSEEPVLPESLGYRLQDMEEPILKVGNGRTCFTSAKKNFFKEGYGYFQSPLLSKDHFNLAVIALKDFCEMKEGEKEESLDLKSLLQSYFPKFLLTYGLYANFPLHATNEKEKMGKVASYFKTQVFPITSQDLSCEQFTDDFVRNLENAFHPDAYLVVVPQETDTLEDDTSPYGLLKGVLCQKNRANQMLEEEHAKEICFTKRREVLKRLNKNVDDYISKENQKKAYSTGTSLMAQNINMGILSKMGGIPFIAEKMSMAPDLFIGIDVGQSKDRMHYPSCSVACYGDGKFLGYIQPTDAIPGEKIPKEALYDLLNKIISKYKELNGGKYPKSVIIHRDGFAHEDLTFYEEFFGKLGIRFSLFEVRKSGAPRIMDRAKQGSWTPKKGTALIQEEAKKALLVTTAPMSGGAPAPIQIEWKYGDVDITTAVQQIYTLTKVDIASTWDVRYPITIKMADAVCKFRKYLPKGNVETAMPCI